LNSQQQLGLYDAVAIERSPSRFVQKDLCANRHGGNAESQEAHERVKAGKLDMWARILAWALTQPHGFTCDEAAIHFMCPPNAISGRLSELKAQGRLVPTGERRKTERGCAAAVLVVKR